VSEGRQVDDWIDGYIRYTEGWCEAPVSYRRWTAISTVAACLQRKCYMQWEKTQYPNMYIVLVGPSGARKGTAMIPAASMLRDIGIPLSPEAVTREQLIRRIKKSNSDFVSDEGKPMVQSSLTIFSEELTVFLGYNNVQLMADLCAWYDCPNPWSYETKHDVVKDNIPNVWVNMIGATTPRLLQTTLPQDTIGGGLTSRIVFVYEPRKGRTITRPFKTESDVILGEQLKRDLSQLYMLAGEFIPNESYIHKWDDWYGMQEENPPFSDPRLEAYLTRRGTHVLKLSMIMNASRINGGMTLDGSDFDRAVGELERIEKKMPQVFLGIGSSDIAAVTANVMRTIAFKKVTTFNELLGMHMQDADYETMKKIMTTVSSMEKDGRKYCRWDVIKGIIEYNP
jgi:hypothetical protein